MKLWKKGLALCLILCIRAGMTITSGAESPGIPIDSGTFPDPAFLSWVQQNDTDADGFLSQTEREAVTQMDLRKQGIQDLSGLEWFDRLEKLIAVKMICSPWSWRISRVDIADLQRKSQAVKPDAERCARAGAAFLLSLQSLSLFVWALAAGAAAYAISHLWRYLQGRKTGQVSGGDLFLTILPMAFAVFSLSWPQAILSFLPLVLGALLMVDGVGKAPLVIAAIRSKPPILIPLLLSSLIPTILGVLLVVNPFRATRDG